MSTKRNKNDSTSPALLTLIRLSEDAIRLAYVLGLQQPRTQNTPVKGDLKSGNFVDKRRACEILGIARATLDRIRVPGKYFDPDFPPAMKRNGHKKDHCKWLEKDLFTYRDLLASRRIANPENTTGN